MSNTKQVELETKVESELLRLDWLATDESPCLAVTYADANLPMGWVRVEDDYACWGFGPVDEIVSELQDIEEGTDYDSAPQFGGDPRNSRDWPAELISFEQLEEGTCNDNPNTLITVCTNAGVRYAAGPHGVSCCALSEWIDSGAELAESREEAIASLSR